MSVFGVLHPCRQTDGEIWHGGGDLRAKFHPHRCNVPQNRPLSKLIPAACAARNAASNKRPSGAYPCAIFTKFADVVPCFRCVNC